MLLIRHVALCCSAGVGALYRASKDNAPDPVLHQIVLTVQISMLSSSAPFQLFVHQHPVATMHCMLPVMYAAQRKPQAQH